MLDNAKVGQKTVCKVLNFPGRIWEREATVTAVNEYIVTVAVDVNASTLRFRRDTGANVYGKRYGWLELIPA